MSNTHKKGLPPQYYDNFIKELQIEKATLLKNQLYSEDPEDVIKAQAYLSSQTQSSKKSAPQAYFFAPDWTHTSGKPYKDQRTSVPDSVLRKVSYVHIIDLIITTKINQILNFLKFTTDEQSIGFTVRKKLSRFEDKYQAKLTKQDESEIDRIVDFIENSGEWGKWDIKDDMQKFISKVVRDSFTFNRSCFEKEWTFGDKLKRYTVIDPQTVRLLETIDPHFEARNSQYNFVKKNGYLPRYCQIWNGQIAENPLTREQIVWYPWELGYEVRRDSSDIWTNGYPVGEIEILTNIVTWILNGLQFNGNFFKNGSNQDVILNIKNGDGGGQQIMNQLRQLWTQSMVGVENSHKMPVVEGLDMEVIKLKEGSNKDMEFQLWNEFLIVLTCGVFTIDPSELGFHFKQQSDQFGQKGEKERLDHSFNKGLKPILVWLQKLINKHFVSELNDKYEFVWCGVDLDDETQQLDNDKKKIDMGAISQEDVFQKYSHRKFDPKKDTILNSVYQQAQQAKMYGGEGMNDMVDEETGEPEEGVQNPFQDYEKAVDGDPIMKAMDGWLKDRGFIERK